MTPCSAKSANRSTQRQHIFFDRLLSLTGGSLAGMKVLDLGCNAGYWALQAIEAGADSVFGIDGRQMHIDQSNLVFETKGVDRSRYQFELGNFFTYPLATFDLVLCLGVLYHVASPVELFNVMAATAAELIVIDTGVSQLTGDAFALTSEPLDGYRNAIEEEMVMYPTRGAVRTLASRHGYDVVTLDPGSVTDWNGMADYQAGRRAAFICSNRGPSTHFHGKRLLARASCIAFAKRSPNVRSFSGQSIRDVPESRSNPIEPVCAEIPQAAFIRIEFPPHSNDVIDPQRGRWKRRRSVPGLMNTSECGQLLEGLPLDTCHLVVVINVVFLVAERRVQPTRRGLLRFR